MDVNILKGSHTVVVTSTIVLKKLKVLLILGMGASLGPSAEQAYTDSLNQVTKEGNNAVPEMTFLCIEL